jgi:hypothetical protein
MLLMHVNGTGAPAAFLLLGSEHLLIPHGLVTVEFPMIILLVCRRQASHYLIILYIHLPSRPNWHREYEL